MTANSGWRLVRPDRARMLTDARLQLHHAAQFATALGVSYLEHSADDSHTNLGWSFSHEALTSRSATGNRGPVSIRIRACDLRLEVVTEREATPIELQRSTIASVEESLRSALDAAGLDPARFMLDRYYELPHHPVADGAAFDTTDADAFGELSVWLGNAAGEFARIVAATPEASEVRVWPHHFDIATLVSFPNGASMGLGLEPGDQYYDEPYLYVNVHPQPSAERLTMQIGGGGSWHTHEWIGAVLPGSRLAAAAADQQAQVRAYLDSALAACRGLVTS